MTALGLHRLGVKQILSFRIGHPFSVDLARSIGSSSNSDIELNSRFVNRNPRNLEQMLVARKPLGWEWDRPSRTYWYRLEILLQDRSVTAKVLHNTGGVLVEASTIEWGIRKQMVSACDTNSSLALGRVLARRCLEAGIVAVHVELPEELKASKKALALIEGFALEGVNTKELDSLDEIKAIPITTLYR